MPQAMMPGSSPQMAGPQAHPGGGPPRGAGGPPQQAGGSEAAVVQDLAEAIEMSFQALDPAQQDILARAITPEVAAVFREIFPQPLHSLVDMAEGAQPGQQERPQDLPPDMGAAPGPDIGQGGMDAFAAMVG